jgi:hypothetical protein
MNGDMPLCVIDSYQNDPGFVATGPPQLAAAILALIWGLGVVITPFHGCTDSFLWTRGMPLQLSQTRWDIDSKRTLLEHTRSVWNAV